MMAAAQGYKDLVAKLAEQREAGTVTHVQSVDKVRDYLKALSPEAFAACKSAAFQSPPYDPRFPNQNQTR